MMKWEDGQYGYSFVTPRGVGSAERFSYESGVLPELVRMVTGANGTNPRLTVGGTTHGASYLNDSMNLSFEQIADLIEENFINNGEDA